MKRYLVWITLLAFVLAIPVWGANTSGTMGQTQTTKPHATQSHPAGMPGMAASPGAMTSEKAAGTKTTKMRKMHAKKAARSTAARRHHQKMAMQHRKMAASHEKQAAAHRKMARTHEKMARTHRKAAMHQGRRMAAQKQKSQTMAMGGAGQSSGASGSTY